MAYADDIERILPVENLRMTLAELYQFVSDANNDRRDAEKNSRQNERNADDRARKLADAHAHGWEKVARAIDNGFREVAQAIRDSNR